MTQAYAEGFNKAAEEAGFDSEALLKLAFSLAKTNVVGNPLGNVNQNMAA